MTFKIAVFVKQVPDTNEIRWTKNNTLQREGLDSIINPFDVGAVLLAKNFKKLLIKQGIETEITAITMGPKQACDVLDTALVYGCDRAVLLSDKRFSGADTLATAYTLSQFIKTKMPDVSLIVCGQQAIDGDTAQTPSSLAQKLEIAQITNVTAIKEINNVYAVLEKETNSSKEILKSGYPLLIATTIQNPYIKSEINDYIRAQNTKTEIYNAEDILADPDKIGLKGSPTIVKNAYRPDLTRETQYFDNFTAEETALFILDEIEKCRLCHE